jgi:RimJ/RimL family protein N-acetyltransferase
MVVATTERLVLRHMQLRDSGPLDGVFGDAEVMRFGDGVQTQAWVRAWLHRCLHSYQARGFGPYAVVERQQREVIGYCGLFFMPDVGGQPEVELGYRLARAWWGQGYATEAAMAVRDYAFAALGLNRLIAMIDPHNTASLRVAEKLGMHYEQDIMFDGYTHPDHVYVVTAAGAGGRRRSCPGRQGRSQAP